MVVSNRPDSIGAFIALVGTFGVPLVTEHVKKDHERKSIAALIAGELAGTLSVINGRGYLQSVKASIDEMLKNPNRIICWSFSVGEDVARIYRTVSDRIGILPYPVSEHVIQTYDLLFSALEDIKALNRITPTVETFMQSGAWSGDSATWEEGRRQAFLYYRALCLNTFQGLFGAGVAFMQSAEKTLCELQDIARDAAPDI